MNENLEGIIRILAEIAVEDYLEELQEEREKALLENEAGEK